MTTLWALLGGIGSVIAAIVIAFLTGGRSAKHKRDAQDARREADTFKRAKDAQDEMGSADDDYVSRWLRERARK